ncbi:uncharacterized protein DEA37_0006624 [Paragonimus westermani]|uniref:RRM domain-containing protein n=1 Tax=Paragonimus westermani TaxID=34504 RepID=A0A5J4N704_9TREM|nr:uncharacterized protein DEA37_0006624 [Paragonimus westermani]
MRSLYVAPIPPNCSLGKLKQLSPTLVSCRLSYNPHTRVCRQYAVVKFVNPDVSLEAFGQVHGRPIRGQPVFVNFVISQKRHGLNQQQKAEQSKRSLESSANVLQPPPPSIPPEKAEVYNPTSAGEPLTTASSVSQLSMSTVSCTKASKVLIQPIIETETDPQPDPFEKWSAEALFVRPCDKSVPKNSTILAKLVKAHKRRRNSSPESSDCEGALQDNPAETEVETAEEPAMDNESDEGKDDVESEAISNSSVSADSSDAENACVTDSEEVEEKEEDSRSASNSDVLLCGKPTMRKLDEVKKLDDNSDDDINNMLGTVMRARRRATRALKTAGSSKRNWGARTVGSQKGKKQQSDQFRRIPKPFMLPVPEKRMKI